MSLPNWNLAQEAAMAPYIDAAAEEYGIDRATLYGLVALESGFNPNAYRAEPTIGDGSRGLMQVLLRTAQGLGFSGDATELYDPALSLQLGCEYLVQQIDRFNTMDKALSAYNGGYVNSVITNQAYVDGVNARAQYFRDRWAQEAAGVVAPPSSASDDSTIVGTLLAVFGAWYLWKLVR